ncbi:MAG: YgiT-type zinc finger protein [Caldilineaceae bacterium]|nr:YgiT-type zinc finger protein [Caldilineaceae bacterium]
MGKISQIQALVRYALYDLTEPRGQGVRNHCLQAQAQIMSDENEITGFWQGEICEYCGGPIVEKQVTLHRHVEGKYFLFEHLPAGVCQVRGTRDYAANTLKAHRGKCEWTAEGEREVLLPVYSM